MKRITQVLLLALMAAVLAGCAGSSSKNLASFTSDKFPVSSGQSVVNDVASRIHGVYPPGKTAIYLTGKDEFGTALESNLREKGFTIAQEPGNGVLTVAWTVDELEDGLWYLVVNLSDGNRFTRVYNFDGLAISPTGSLSHSSL